MIFRYDCAHATTESSLNNEFSHEISWNYWQQPPFFPTIFLGYLHVQVELFNRITRQIVDNSNGFISQ